MKIYQILANIVLIIHFLYILFVVVGFVLIVIGGFLKWNWTRNIKFRILHLLAIGFVVMESWLNIDCPLTVLENWLRTLGGSETYEEDFVAHWIRKIIFYEAPSYVFTALYTFFGALVVFAWCKFPPKMSN